MEIGEFLVPLEIEVTATHIIKGASASRDWQPQHHDRDWAREQAGTPDIFMNTPTQMGLIERFVTDRAGTEARLAKLRFRMRRPICPGHLLRISGVVEGVRDLSGCRWLDLDITLEANDVVATSCSTLVAVPSDARPWSLGEQLWADAVAALTRASERTTETRENARES